MSVRVYVSECLCVPLCVCVYMCVLCVCVSVCVYLVGHVWKVRILLPCSPFHREITGTRAAHSTADFSTGSENSCSGSHTCMASDTPAEQSPQSCIVHVGIFGRYDK